MVPLEYPRLRDRFFHIIFGIFASENPASGVYTFSDTLHFASNRSLEPELGAPRSRDTEHIFPCHIRIFARIAPSLRYWARKSTIAATICDLRNLLEDILKLFSDSMHFPSIRSPAPELRTPRSRVTFFHVIFIICIPENHSIGDVPIIYRHYDTLNHTRGAEPCNSEIDFLKPGSELATLSGHFLILRFFTWVAPSLHYWAGGTP